MGYLEKVLVFGGLLLLAECVCYRVGAQVTHPIEVGALLAITKSLKDPKKYLSSWNKGDPCNSNWTGVLCFNKTQNDGYLHVRELDFMWNNINGVIPKEIGDIKSLNLLLLNGNQLTGSLPEELGFLPNLDRIQIDENYISGPLPKSFANLKRAKHFHMNNNSISGEIPSELANLPTLVHFLLDNNNLSGYLPPEFSKLPKLQILQLDNNHFDGTIPASYRNMSKLLKLSLRNCSLHGAIPDLSRISNLAYLDLSWNQLNGSIPSNKLSDDVTTIDLSFNNLSGPIPANFSGLPHLQKLSLGNNSLSGVVPSNIWKVRILNATETLLLDFQNNIFSNISGSLNPPENVTIRLHGNPLCAHANQLHIVQLCRSHIGSEDAPKVSSYTTALYTEASYTKETCPIQSCPEDYEYVKDSPVRCFCAAPIRVGFRMKSPGFSDFRPYEKQFQVHLTSGLHINLYQLSVDSFVWETGPRLRMYLKLFPEFNNHSHTFNDSEIQRIKDMFTGWTIPNSDIFGPHELLDFTLLGPYAHVVLDFAKSGISKSTLAGIIVGVAAGAIIVSAILTIYIMRENPWNHHRVSKRRQPSRVSMRIDGVKTFTFQQMALATNNFDITSQIGQGGYGKVYKGILADGSMVAVKRALEGSLQGDKEFLTEIELLSRVHHRNLVSLIGYCDEEGEQMLVYEFMANGTLRDHLSVRSKEALDFAMRLKLALHSAKGILYLHTEADPPIFHRDIKASNILLDSRFTAKVADFGLSRLAPVPDMEGIVAGHISTVVKGTPGYLDPEYFLTRKLTDKSDVYSLGVVFLELLTGMQPISHGKNIIREVNMAYQSGMIFSMIDERMGSYPSECVGKFVTLALNCCQHQTELRPCMADVVRELEKIWLMVPDSDVKPSHSVTTCSDSGKSSLSISGTRNPYGSLEVSGSDLVSGEIPLITPR